ncbi:Nucleoporin nup49/NSP49 (Nuclear pore protein nup49/NSP49) [Rhizina undulata]
MSLFGRVNTPASTGTGTTPSLFGNTNTAPPSTSGLFGASPATSAPASTGGLFGTTAPAAASSAPATGGLFGIAASTAPTQTGGLFGGTSTTPTTSLAGGGPFGANPAATAGATGAAPATGGLFGAAPASNTATTGGLFGGAAAGTTAASSTPAANTTGGLFGGAAPATTQPSGGLFGGSVASKPAGLFGSTTTGMAPTQQQPYYTGAVSYGDNRYMSYEMTNHSLFTGAGATGNTANQSTTAVPAAKVDLSRLSSTTRFLDCQESIQLELEALEKHILSQIEIANELNARFPTHRELVESVPNDFEVLSHKLATTKSFLSADQAALENARALHQQDSDAASLSIRTLDLFRMPHAQRSQYLQRTGTFSASTAGAGVLPMQRENEITSNKPMIDYFNKHADQMEHKLRVFLDSVQEVEMSLKSVEAQAAQAIVDGVGGEAGMVNGAAKSREDARRLNRALREFNDALRDISGRIVEVKDGLRELRSRGARK